MRREFIKKFFLTTGVLNIFFSRVAFAKNDACNFKTE